MTTPLSRTYIWLNINDADLPAVQNIFHRLDTGAVQISFVLTIFQKPAEHNFFSISHLKENQLKSGFSLLNEGETWSSDSAFLPVKPQTHKRRARRRSPVLVNHAVKDLSTGEVIISVRLLVTFWRPGGIWKFGKATANHSHTANSSGFNLKVAIRTRHRPLEEARVRFYQALPQLIHSHSRRT